MAKITAASSITADSSLTVDTTEIDDAPPDYAVVFLALEGQAARLRVSGKRGTVTLSGRRATAAFRGRAGDGKGQHVG